jgi:hypothetical protein
MYVGLQHSIPDEQRFHCNKKNSWIGNKRGLLRELVSMISGLKIGFYLKTPTLQFIFIMSVNLNNQFNKPFYIY